MIELTEIEQMAYDAIEEIQGIKRDNKQQPDFAFEREIYNSINAEIKDALRSLYRKNLIEFHRNINGVEMFGLKQAQPNEK